MPVLALVFALLTVSCGHTVVTPAHAAGNPVPPPDPPAQKSHTAVRATGTIEAIHTHLVQTPQIAGQGGRITLTAIAPNGAMVKQGDVIAEFDATQQLDAAIQAKAKFDDLSHQVEQRRAQNTSDAEKRAAELQKAEGDQAKAEIELRKGPLLSEIDRLKNEAKAEDARAHVSSLKKSDHFHDLSDAAALRILELQRDRRGDECQGSSRNKRQPGLLALRRRLDPEQAHQHSQQADRLRDR